MTDDLPPMPNTPPPAPKPAGKRRRTLIVIAAVAVAALAIAGTVVWVNATSYDDTVAACKKALTAQMKAGGEGKPSACKDVKQDDYDALVVANVIDGMSKKDRDMLDYYDDGSIDGSLG